MRLSVQCLQVLVICLLIFLILLLLNHLYKLFLLLFLKWHDYRNRLLYNRSLLLQRLASFCTVVRQTWVSINDICTQRLDWKCKVNFRFKEFIAIYNLCFGFLMSWLDFTDVFILRLDIQISCFMAGWMLTIRWLDFAAFTLCSPSVIIIMEHAWVARQLAIFI